MAQLTDEAAVQIELAVRRLLSSEDTALRKVWADEAKTYREFLQSQFRWITIGVSSLAAVGVALFVWFFSDSVSQTQIQIGKVLADAKETMLMTIDSKVIDYRILQDLKSRVESMVKIEVGNQAEKTTKDIIQPKVTQLAIAIVDEIANKKIDEAIAIQIKKIQSFNVEELLQHAAIPAGAIAAFSQGCPTGWGVFAGAAGRTIIGAGQSGDSTLRSSGEFGGSEFHSLSIEELPQQQIELGGLVGLSSVDRYNAGGSDYPVVGKTNGVLQIGGLGKSFSTMPPFLVLYYCKKE